MQKTIDNLSCVRCGSKLQGDHEAADELTERQFICLGCRHAYASLWGIPYIADFETADILGLVEIAANIDNATQNENITKAHFDQWRELLKACHASDDPHKFMRNAPDWAAPWMLSRYNQWYQYNLLTAQLDLSGSRALDVGAGLGFDTSDVLADGACVTALEFSPLLARAGKKALPEVQWIGGISHALPFDDNSFDFIFCNAALHHMRDVPAALLEMIRVVRCGGTIVTTSDSYCADCMPGDLELSIFNNDPTVLSGVNEGIIRFSDLVYTLETYSNHLDIQAVVDARGTAYQRDADRFGFLLLDFKRDREIISNRFQSISLKITLKSKPAVPRRLQKPDDVILPASRYANLLDNQAAAIASLTSLIPLCHVDIPFPGKSGSKFALLNGWQNPVPGVVWRQGYKRARLFFSRKRLLDTTSVCAKCVVEKDDQPKMDVLANGKIIHTVFLKRNCWTLLPIPYDRIGNQERCAIEFQMHRKEENFNEGLFRISFVAGWRLWLNDRLAPVGLAFSKLRDRFGRVKRAVKMVLNLEKINMRMRLLVDSVLQIIIIRKLIAWLLQKMTPPILQSLVKVTQGDLSNSGLLEKEGVRTAVLKNAVKEHPRAVESILGQELQGQLSFSHEGEDILLKRLTDIEKSGFYVDVGAHDPRAFSNTYLLYMGGWRGVNIDATPGSMESFKRLRPRDINLEYGVSDSFDELTFHTFKASALNTLSDDIAARYVSNGWESKGQVKIKTRPLAAILDDVLPKNQEIDLLNVDVEGNEYSVLASNDWDRFRPTLIFVEILDVPLDEVNDTAVAKLLGAKGYLMIAKLSTTVVFKLCEMPACAE